MEKLTWKAHVEHQKSNVAKIIEIVQKLKGPYQNTFLKLLDTALLLPYLNYCVVVWTSGYQHNYAYHVHISIKGDRSHQDKC